MTDEQHATVNILLNAINDIERVGDHADNLAELAQYRIDNKILFSDEAIEELKIMFDKAEKVYIEAIEAFKTSDIDKAEDVLKLEGSGLFREEIQSKSY